MNIPHYFLILITTFVISIVLAGCGGDLKSEAPEGKKSQSIEKDPDGGVEDDEEETQEEIQHLATSSLENIIIDGEFGFETQRMVKLVLDMEDSPPISKILVFIESQEGDNHQLLVSGNVGRSQIFRNTVSVPYTINHLMVIVEYETTSYRIFTVNIDENDQVQYILI